MYYPGVYHPDHISRLSADMIRYTKPGMGVLVLAVIPAEAGIHFAQSSSKRQELQLIRHYVDGRIGKT